jgi:hypothetical protein
MFLLLAVVLFVFANTARADYFEDFKKEVQESLIKPFAEDFGGLIGGADFNSGRTVGFPGFDVGLVLVAQSKPNDDNKILKNAKVNTFGIPFLQGSIGLPLVGMDVAVRGITYSGLTVIGGGVRYSFHKSGIAKFIPDVMVSGFYDVINYEYFKGSHYSLNASASFDIPVVKPFVGIGFDNTEIEVKGTNTSLDGVSASTGKIRSTAGIKIIPFPFLYVFGAYSIFHGQSGYQLGAGAKF